MVADAYTVAKVLWWQISGNLVCNHLCIDALPLFVQFSTTSTTARSPK